MFQQILNRNKVWCHIQIALINKVAVYKVLSKVIVHAFVDHVHYTLNVIYHASVNHVIYHVYNFKIYYIRFSCRSKNHYVSLFTFLMRHYL